MKQLSGKYSEIEFVKKRQRSRGKRSAALRHSVQAKRAAEWDETVQKLAAMFGDRPVAAQPAAVQPVEQAATLTQIKTESIEPLAGRRDALLRDGSNRKDR